MVWTRILEAYAYVISPMTLVELLLRLHRGDDDRFVDRKRPLRLLHGTRSNPKILELPGASALRTA